MLGVWFLPTFVINLYGIFSGPTHFGKKNSPAFVCGAPRARKWSLGHDCPFTSRVPPAAQGIFSFQTFFSQFLIL
jgi:hypothetical protein